MATVFLTRKYTRLYLWLVGLTAVYGLIHFILLFSTDQPLDTGLLASAYNLRLFAYVIMGYSLALLLPKTDLTRRFAKLLILLSTIVCIIAFLQWLLPKDIMEHFGYSIERGVKPNFFIDDKPDLPRVFSTLRDPNSLGAFLILPITLLTQALARNWRTAKRNLLIGLLMLYALVLLLTFSRSTLLATVLALLTLLVLQNGKYFKAHAKSIFVGLGVLVLLASAVLFFARDAYVVQNLVFHADESTIEADPNEKRIKFLMEGAEGVVDKPLGHGPGTAGLVSTRNQDTAVLTENYFLQIGYEAGFIGLIVFTSILYLILKNLWAQRANYLVAALIASFVGLVFANMFFHTWANEAVSISWFMAAGIALSLPSKNPPHSAKPVRVRR